MIDTPPLSINIPSSDDQENDNRSGLIEPYDDNDDGDDDVNSQNNEGEFDRIIAMMDPQFKIDDQKPSLSSSGISNQIVIATAPIKEKKQVLYRIELKQNIVHQKKLLAEKQELLHLKLQISKHKKMLHLLSSKLTKSQVKNESLKVEKASLVDELALARDTIERDVVVAVNNDDVEEQSTSLYGRFSLRGVGNNNSNNYGGGGSMQMLLDRNARLMSENARLQASQDDIRKSFQSHIKFTQSISRADKEAIADLKRENGVLRKSLRQQQQQQRQQKVVVPYSAARNSVQLFESEDTSKTDLTADDDTSDENQDDNDSALKHTIKLCSLGDSKHNTKYKGIKIDDKDIKEEDGKIDIDKKDRVRVENAVAPDNGRRMSEKLLVDFGVCRRRSRGAGRRWCSLSNVTT